jgi:hypothetical protein
LPDNVKVDRTTVGEAYGNASALCTKFIRQLAKWLEQGKFKPLNVQIVEGGLKGVPKGLKLLEEGKVSAAKLVCELLIRGCAWVIRELTFPHNLLSDRIADTK